MRKSLLKNRSRFVDLLVIVLISAFSIWLMWYTFGYVDGQLVIASKLWSDFGAHIPLVRSFSFGNNWPPEYPHFSGEPIKYHYLFYALVALLEQTGLNLAFSMNLFSAAGLILLLTMVYVYGKQLFKSQVAGIVAVLLVLFNGSLTFVDFFVEHGLSRSSFAQILSLEQFVNFGPWNGDHISAFWNLNIYTNQRHLAGAFGLILLLLWPLVKAGLVDNHKFQPSKKVLVGMIAAAVCLPLLHNAIIPVFGILAGWWLLFHRHLGTRALLLIVIMGFVSMPATWLIAGQHVLFKPGFLAPEPRLLPWLEYWWLNIGVYLLLLPLLFWWGNRHAKALLLGGLSLFTLANLWQLSSDMINNHKLVNFFLIILAIVTAGFLLWLWHKKPVTKILSVVLFLSLTISGIIDLFPILNDYSIKLNDVALSETATWIGQQTPTDAIFLPANKFYNPASLAGRKLFYGYSYFPWSMGYDTGEREQLSRQLFSDTIERNDLCSLLLEHRIDYVILANNEGEIGDTDVQVSTIRREFEPVFESITEGQFIYQVDKNCEQ